MRETLPNDNETTRQRAGGAPSVSRRGPPWRAMLPTLVVLGVGLVWSIAWFSAASWLEGEIEDGIARMADRGLSLTCETGGLEGYPFRFAYDCQGADLAGPGYRIRVPRVLATVQAYDPRHMIAQVEGPGIVEAGGRSVDASWESLLGSGRTTWGAIGRIIETGIVDPLQAITELGLSATALELTDGAATASADRLSAFARPAFESVGRDIEIAVDVAALTAAGLTTGPADTSLRARLFALPANLHEADLRDWLGAEGAIGVTRWDVSAGAGTVRASGRLDADAAGTANGTLTLAAANPQAFATALTDPGLGSLAATLSNALLLTGRATDIDGRDALAVDITIAGGDVSLGFLPLGALPPLLWDGPPLPAASG